MKVYVWLAGVALVGACGSEPKAEASPAAAAPPAAVLGASDVAIAERRDVIVGVPVSGTLEPAVDVRITAPVPELLDVVLVKEGEAVQRGQVLARFRSDLVRATALSAEARQRFAAADYERMQNLFKEGAVAQRDVENAEAALRAAEAAAAQASQQLEDATVRAPMAGVIAERFVETGDRVKDGDPLFRLVNTRQLEFAASVPSQFIGDLRPGMPVSLVVTGIAGQTLRGQVSRVNATADQATRQVRVYVTVPNEQRRLVGGLFASGRVITQRLRNTVAVPEAALRSSADSGSHVLLVEEGKIARRAVTTGGRDEVAGVVAITSGLSGGETVIVGAAEGLRPGAAVTVSGREGGQ